MKKKISFILTIYFLIFIVFTDFMSVDALAIETPTEIVGYIQYQKSKNGSYTVDNFLDDSMRQIYSAWGIIVDEGIQINKTIADFVDWTLDNPAQGLPQLYVDFWNQFGDEEEAVEKTIDEAVKVNPNTGQVKYSPEFTQYINTTINQMVNSSGTFYAYSFDIMHFTSNFASSDLYNAVRQFILNNPDKLVVIQQYNIASDTYLHVYDINNSYFVLNGSNGTERSCFLYNKNWERATGVSYKFNTDTKEFEQRGSVNNYGYITLTTNQNGVPSGANYLNTISYSVSQIQLVYKTLVDFQNATVGQNPYYFSDQYNNNKNITGSYNTSTSNIDNSITYGDIQSYQDSFNTTNGTLPTQQDIYNYINNYIPDGGGSGGGSGGESGGGSGGSSGEGIFDFLSQLGAVLGNLIKNLGQAITNIIEGLVSLIDNLVVNLPQAFFDMIGAIFGWMPEEWVSLMSFALASMILFAIIKIIRG